MGVSLAVILMLIWSVWKCACRISVFIRGANRVDLHLIIFRVLASGTEPINMARRGAHAFLASNSASNPCRRPRNNRYYSSASAASFLFAPATPGDNSCALLHSCFPPPSLGSDGFAYRISKPAKQKIINLIDEPRDIFQQPY